MKDEVIKNNNIFSTSLTFNLLLPHKNVLFISVLQYVKYQEFKIKDNNC